MKARWIPRILGVGALGLSLALSGCTTGDEATVEPTSAPMPVESSLPAPDPTSQPPVQGETAESTPLPTTSDPTTAALTLFYVAVGDAGVAGPEIGCGDSIVATETTPMEFTDPVGAALSTLLAFDEPEHGASGLQNALAESDLHYVSATVAGDTVTVELSGSVVSGGTCDDPRIIEQLQYTAMTAAGTGHAEIRVDGQPLQEVLSVK
ncbi:GerMN domain-containing protein [Glutamicibacter uratoxydans]|uniref:GerMN domain-containing protein n=1 Tax=Glutamicibacter uratoxydans TaxID=43667 RepID=UPI003D6FE11D